MLEFESSELDDIVTTLNMDIDDNDIHNTFDSITSYTDDDYQDSFSMTNDYETLSSFLNDDDDTSPMSTNSNISINSDQSNEVLTRSFYNNLITNKTNATGKFLRDMNISYDEASSLWCLLKQCPKKERQQYGARKKISEDERIKQTRHRNRLHATHTRLRKRIFSAVLKLREENKKIQMDITSKSNENLHINENFFDNYY